MSEYDEALSKLQNEWNSLSHIISELGDPLDNQDLEDGNRTLRNLHDSDSTPVLQEFLSELGFRKFKLLGMGGVKICLLSVDNQIIKLSFPSIIDDKRPKHPAVLKPIYSHELIFPNRYGAIKLGVEIYPKINIDKFSKAELEPLQIILADSGLKVNDLNKGTFDISKPYQDYNVGYITTRKDKKLLFLIDDDYLKGELKDNKEALIAAGYVDVNGIWTQNKLDSRIGTGKPTGVLSDKSLGVISAKGGGEISDLVKSCRLYTEGLPNPTKRMSVGEYIDLVRKSRETPPETGR